MSFLSIDHINISFNDNVIFSNFCLELEKGSIYSLVGPSGCGKSTLLKAISGIIQLQGRGAISMNGERLEPQKQRISYIPQQYGLLNWLKIKDNLSLVEQIRHEKAPNKQHIIEQLALVDLMERYPRELSGGQKQRVALARAWLLQPDLLLMDEPFSSLDAFTAQRSLDFFVELWKEQKTTTLFVTHNLSEAVKLGKYIVLLSKNLPCRIEKIIENPLFRKGASRDEEDFYQFEKTIRDIVKQSWRAENE